MTETVTTSAATAGTFYDLSEVREAMADPLYKTSPRFRDEVAAKLHRSHVAGTVARMGEDFPQGERVFNYDKPNLAEGIYGGAQPMPKPISPFTVLSGGTFKSLEEIHTAMSVPSAADPSYRRVVTECIERSIREGALDERARTQVAAWQAEASAQRGR